MDNIKTVLIVLGLFAIFVGASNTQDSPLRPKSVRCTQINVSQLDAYLKKSLTEGYTLVDFEYVNTSNIVTVITEKK